MAPPAKGAPFGAYGVLISRLTADNQWCGQLDPSSLTPGATSHGYWVEAVNDVNLPQITYGQIQIKGNQQTYFKLDTGAIEFGELTIDLPNNDRTLKTLLGGGNIDTTTIAGAQISGSNELNPTTNKVAIVVYEKQASLDSATLGTVGWNMIVIQGTGRVIRGSLSQAENQTNPTILTLQFAVTKQNKLPGGVPFSANQNFYGNEAVMYEVASDYQYDFTAFVGDGADDDYDLAYVPIDTTVTGGNQQALHTVNGAATAPTSIVSNAVTLASAPGSGVLAGSWYATNKVTP